MCQKVPKLTPFWRLFGHFWHFFMIFGDFSRFCWFLWSSEALTLFHDFFQKSWKSVAGSNISKSRNFDPPKSWSWFSVCKLVWHPLPELVPPRPKMTVFGLGGWGAPKTPKTAKMCKKVPKNRLFYAQNGCFWQKYRKFGSTGRPHPSESGWDGPCRQTLFWGSRGRINGPGGALGAPWITVILLFYNMFYTVFSVCPHPLLR